MLSIVSKTPFVLLAMLFFTSPVAAGINYTGHVTQIFARADGQIFVKFDTSAPAAGAPVCSTSSTWNVSFTMTATGAEAMLSNLISSKMSGTEVQALGGDSCVVEPTVEDLRSVTVR